MGAPLSGSARGAPLLSPANYRVPAGSDGLLRLTQEAFALSSTSLCALAWSTGIPPASLSRLLRRSGDPGLSTLERALAATGQAVWCVDPGGAWYPILPAATCAATLAMVPVEGAESMPPLMLLAKACRHRGLGARALAQTAGIAVASAHRLLAGSAPRGWHSVGSVLATLGYRLVVADTTGDLIRLTLPEVRGEAGERSHLAHLAALDRYRAHNTAYNTSQRRGRLLLTPERLMRLVEEGVTPRALAAMAGVGMARLRQVLLAHGGAAARPSAIDRRAAGNQPRLIAGAARN